MLTKVCARVIMAYTSGRVRASPFYFIGREPLSAVGRLERVGNMVLGSISSIDCKIENFA